jgi:hypothetical protein
VHLLLCNHITQVMASGKSGIFSHGLTLTLRIHTIGDRLGSDLGVAVLGENYFSEVFDCDEY